MPFESPCFAPQFFFDLEVLRVSNNLSGRHSRQVCDDTMTRRADIGRERTGLLKAGEETERGSRYSSVLGRVNVSGDSVINSACCHSWQQVTHT
jgi:hypothetical protein